jgi:hypothetical protein
LLGAVARKDSRYLLSIVSPNIRIHLGPGGEGPAAFMEEWKLDQAASSPIWDELSAALALGCARDRGEMSSPYLFSRFPDDLDALESVIVIEPEAVLRAAPHRTAPAMARLSAWKILTRTQPHGGDERWLRVRTSNGQPGYVEAQAVRSPSDFRVVFEKSDGRWIMTYLLAGD